MGYRHSWSRPKIINLTLWRQITSDFERLVPALERRGIPLMIGGRPQEPVSIGEDEIRFDGSWPKHRSDRIHPYLQRIFEPDWKEFDWAELRGRGCCDGFHFPRVERFDCGGCKTNRYNYEIAVQCLVIVAKRHLGDDFAVWSDARRWWWHVPEDICQEVLGYGPGIIVPENLWETPEQLADGEAKIEPHRRTLAEIKLPAKRMVDRIEWWWDDADDDDFIRSLM